jgi:hypothetical protein
MKENFTSGIDEGRQDKLGEACFLLYSGPGGRNSKRKGSSSGTRSLLTL